MSWLAPLLLVLAQAAVPAGAPANIDPKVAAQVPVITEKLHQWRGGWGAIDNKLACKTVKTSGDEEIDKIGCYAVLSCVKPAYPALKAIADAKADEADKKARMRAKLATLEPCMKQYRGQGIALLALKRGSGK